MLSSSLASPISRNCFVNFNDAIRRGSASFNYIKKQKQYYTPATATSLPATRGGHQLEILVAAAAVMLLSCGDAAAAAAAEGLPEPQQPMDETLFNNIPQTLSSGDQCASDSTSTSECKRARIQRPKSRKAESCTVMCVTTCIRGGAGSPGEGPLNARRPLVVFKQGFRSRQYCLVECSDICNLISDLDSGS